MNLNLKNVSKLSFILIASTLIVSCKCDKKNVDGTNHSATAAASTTAVDSNTNEETVSKLDADGNFVYDVGEMTELTLPDGTKLNVGKNSSEAKLYSQLSDTNFSVSDDKTQGWVTLDRVYFSTGSANLTPTSDVQVKNIIALLKAFPEATVKIGGYTDNTGAADVNLKVSTDRAKSIADNLTADGIAAERIAQEGYGAQHFVCEANDTDECKAQNRRVDVRITKK